MGNVLRFLYSYICEPTTTADSESLDPHGVSSATVGVSALAHDLFHFDNTPYVLEGLSKHIFSSKANVEVPEGLSKHVVSSKANVEVLEGLSKHIFSSKANVEVLEGLSKHVVSSKADVEVLEGLSKHIFSSKANVEVPEGLSKHVVSSKANVEGLLDVYGLPQPHWPKGVQFELHTLPVDAKAVADGDTIVVYVSTTDPRESSFVPNHVQLAAVQRSKAQAQRNYAEADALHKQIIKSGYRVLYIQNKEILARKYRIRLRGIDAPESSMPYGEEAKIELTKIVQGKPLRVLVYGEDRYDRSVGDLYCDGKFVQELMLKNGMAWHYAAYDKRLELEIWEKEARAKHVGLWASSDPEEPWEWRKKQRENKSLLQDSTRGKEDPIINIFQLLTKKDAPIVNLCQLIDKREKEGHIYNVSQLIEKRKKEGHIYNFSQLI